MNTRKLGTLGFLVAALSSVPAFSSIVGTDVPLPGRKMHLSDTSGPGGRRNYVALRDGDPAVALPDPRVTGATVRIGRVEAGEVTVLDLPASGWSGSTATGDYKFKSRSGAVIAARLAAGRSIRLSARGDAAYPLGGVPQGGVGIIIDVGGVRFCGFFGGTIVKDDGQRFRARKAPAPAGCPILGTTTTTSTTTSTSSTSTSSTSTSSSSTTSTSTSTTTSSTMVGVIVTQSCGCDWVEPDGHGCGGTASQGEGCDVGCPSNGAAGCADECASGGRPENCSAQATTKPDYGCSTGEACIF